MGARTDTHGWEVKVRSSFERMEDVVLIGRTSSMNTEAITSLSAEAFGSVSVPYSSALPADVQLRLPRGVIEAIVAAARPGPTQAELDQLRADLEYERQQVAWLLDRTVVRASE